MATPRDITGGLTGWAGRPSSDPASPRAEKPAKKRSRKDKRKPRTPQQSPAEPSAVRATDYFSVFVYSLVAVSLLIQGGIALAFSLF